MATRTWTGMVSSDWNNPLNWNPPMVPMSGDDVVLPAAASDYMVGLASTTPALDSLTIGAAGGAGAIELDITGGATLDVTGSGAGATDTITLAEGGNTSIKPTSGSTIKAANLVFANSNGRVVGAGALAISGNISGPGLLEAFGGTLAVSGTIQSGVRLVISQANMGGILQILGTATSASEISGEGTNGLTSAVQMLEIGPLGSLAINAAENIDSGAKIKLDGAASVLNMGANSLVIGNGASLSGQGKVSTSALFGGGTVNGAGIVKASGGTLELTQAIAPTAGLVFDIDTGSTLQLDGTVGRGNPFTFLSASGELGLGNDSGFNDTIAGLHVGAAGAMTNFVDIEGHTVTISSQAFNGLDGTITLSDGAVLNLTLLNAGEWIARAVDDGAGGTDVFLAEAKFFHPDLKLQTFSVSLGWTSQNQYPRFLADVNGDGMADIVGFGYGGVWVSLAAGGDNFAKPTETLAALSYSAGWTSQDQYPRELADINGDGMADIVGFGYGNVWVSLALGGGSFAQPIQPVQTLSTFTYSTGWTSQNQYPRMLADVNGDGKADIVGFGYGGVWVSQATGGGSFAPPVQELSTFSVSTGWTSEDKYPRFLADVNGDGMADIVGFGYQGVSVALATGGGNFAPPNLVLNAFGYSEGWTSQDQYPRVLADVNGDGKADIVGFGYNGVWVALGRGDGTFDQPTFDFRDLGFSEGWTSNDKYPRGASDVTGDHKADLVGFGQYGVYVAISNDYSTATASAALKNTFTS